MGEHGRVQPVGFGQLAGGFGEVMSLAWIDHGHRDLGEHQRGDQPAFPAAGRFDDEAFRRLRARPGDAGGDAVLGIGKVGDAPRGAARGITLCFGDINAHKRLVAYTYRNVLPALRSHAGFVPQAIVRDEGIQASRGHRLSDGVLPHGRQGLS